MPATRCFPAVLCVCLAVVAGSALADDEPEVSLRSHHVRVEVAGRLATTTVEQVYVNYTGDQREAVFQFLLPPGAAVHELAMWVDGLRSPGEVHPRISAERIYREIVDRRRDPALLVCLGEGLWQLRVFPIPPRATQKVEFAYTQVLPIRRQGLAYQGLRVSRLSTVARAEEYDFQAAIRCPGGVKDVVSDRPVGVQRTPDGGVVIGRRAEDAALPTDDEPLAGGPVLFSFLPGQQPPEAVTFGTAPGCFAAVLPAPAALLKPRTRNLVIVLDVSESMAGEKLDLARKCVLEALVRLSDDDAFGLVTVGSDAARWKPDLVPATRANAKAAGEFVAGLKAGGGTDLAAGLRAAGSLNKDTEKVFEILLITDGYDRVGSGLLAERSAAAGAASAPVATAPVSAATRLGLTSQPPPNCRVFALCIGEWLPEALDDLASATGGFAVCGQNLDALRENLHWLEKLMRRPILTDVRATIANNADPQAVDLAASGDEGGGEFVVAGRYGREGTIEVSLAARVDGCPVASQHRVRLPAPGQGAEWSGANLLRVWAHLRGLRVWSDLNADRGGLADLEALVALSREMRVLTPATAFLVLETDGEYIRRGIERQASVLPDDRCLVEVEEEWRKSSRSPEPDQETRRLWAQVRELRRQGNPRRRLQALEEILRGRPDLQAAQEAAVLREFLALREVIQQQQEEQRARREGWEQRPWYAALSDVWAPEPAPVPGGATETIAYEWPLSPADRAAMKKLDAGLAKVELGNERFADALEWLRQQTGLNVYIRWGALQAVGIDRDTRTNLALKDIPAGRFLRVLLDDVGGVNPLGFIVDDGVVTVSTRDDLSRTTVTRVYDIRDLVTRVPRFAGPRLDIGQVGNNAWGGLFGGPAEESGMFGRIPFADSASGDVIDLSARSAFPGAAWESALFGGQAPQNSAEDVIELLRMGIARDSWVENGGIIGSVREFDGRLVVTQTPENHQELVRLLAQLRRHGVSYGSPEPETLFAADGHVLPWVADLLAGARENRLSEFSSVRTRKVGARQFALIAGVWFDTALTAGHRIIPVAVGSEACAVVLRASPDLAECLGQGPPVVAAVGPALAVTVQGIGVGKESDPALKPLLEALKVGNR